MKKLNYLFCLATLLVFINVSLIGQTQLKKWFINGKSVDFSQSTPLVEDMSFIPGDDTKVGNGIYGPDNNLLLYVQSKFIYNRFGDLIHEVNPQNETITRVNPEVEIVPVPNTCKYYVIHNLQIVDLIGLNDDNAIYYTEIDLSLNNGLGGVTVADQPILNDPLSDDQALHGLAVGKLRADDTRFLYYTDGLGKIFKSIISETGITPANEAIFDGGESVDKLLRMLEMELSPDQSKLAFCTFKRDVFSDADVIILHLDANGDVDVSQGNQTENPGTSFYNLTTDVDFRVFTGLEFMADSENMVVGMLPTNSGGDGGLFYLNASDGTSVFIQDSENYGFSELERAWDGNIYFAEDASSLRHIDFSSAIPTISSEKIDLGALPFNDAVLLSNLHAEEFALNTAGDYDGPIFVLPDGIDGENYDDLLAAAPAECCAPFAAYDAGVLAIENDMVWTPQNNPYNSPTIRIGEQLIIPSGRELIIDGITLEFAVEAGVTVEVGARFIVRNGSVLKPIDCENDYWQGVNVYGDATASQFGTTGQGFFTINDSRIEHAADAVALYEPNNEAASTGGIVQATNSVFYNNRRSAEFLRYENFLPFNNQHLGNASRFTNCTFTVDDDYNFPNGSNFVGHITMWNVDGVAIRGCDFENLQTVADREDRKYAIFTIDADFLVLPICLGNQLPCTDFDRSTFTGFYHAIDAQASDCGNLNRNFTVDNAEFSNNITGIFSTAVCDIRVTNNHFDIGQFDLSIPGGTAFIGLDINTGTRYTVEENVFLGELDQIGRTVGVVAFDTGADDNEIRNNRFQNLLYGNFSNGLNRQDNDINDGYGGLRYFCNTNIDNVEDVRVTGILDNNDGIATNQGIMSADPTENALAGAGNTFSHNGDSDFNNFSVANPVIYWYTSFEDFPTVNLSNTFVNSNADAMNGCENRFSQKPADEKLTAAEKTQLEVDFHYHDTNAGVIRTMHDNQIDGGDTDQLTNRVRSFYGSAIDLRDELLTYAPNLSQKVLREVVGRVDILSNTIIYEILSANPDAIRNNEFIKFLEDQPTPLPDYMIDWLLSDANNSTTWTKMEGDIAGHQAAAGSAAKQILFDISQDETGTLTEMRTWLENLENLSAKFSVVETYIGEGNYVAANIELTTIPVDYQLNGQSLHIYNEFKKIKEMEMDLLQANRTWADLDDAEVTYLTTIATTDGGIASGQAQGILHFFYGMVFPSDINFSNSSGARIKARQTPDRVVLEEATIQFAPNPVGDWMSFQYILPEGIQKATLTINNAFGQRVKEIQIENTEGQVIIETADFVRGMYIYSLKIKGYSTISQQFVVTH